MFWGENPFLFKKRWSYLAICSSLGISAVIKLHVIKGLTVFHHTVKLEARLQLAQRKYLCKLTLLAQKTCTVHKQRFPCQQKAWRSQFHGREDTSINSQLL